MSRALGATGYLRLIPMGATGIVCRVKIASMALAVLANDGFGFGNGEVLDTLLQHEVNFTQWRSFFPLMKLKACDPEALHVATGGRNVVLAQGHSSPPLPLPWFHSQQPFEHD